MIELLTPDEMAACDRLAIAGGIAGIKLMERAGRAVADAVARHPLGTRVLVVAGPGNNGGDGFVAARVLAERGYPVRADAARRRRCAAGRCRGSGAAVERSGRAGRAAGCRVRGVIIDALFGAGLNRAVTGVARALIEAMNASGAPIIAVDLPSGINGASGAVMGAAVKAAESVTFFRRKPGHVLLPGRLHAGKVRVADIGIPESVLAARSAANLRERSGAVARGLSGAAARRPQIRARARRGRVGRRRVHRRRAARGARRVAGRRGAGDARKPARGARRQRRREPCRDGARGRRRGGAARSFSPTSGSTRSRSARARASARRPAPWSRPRSMASAPWCSMPTR